MTVVMLVGQIVSLALFEARVRLPVEPFDWPCQSNRQPNSWYMTIMPFHSSTEAIA
jgi:hypothetical protein